VRGKGDVTLDPRDHATTTRPIGEFVANLASADALTGRLEKQSLSEVLQSLEFNKKTGTLELFCGDLSGTLVVYEGLPMFAAFGGMKDADAVVAMLCQRKGYFAFRPKVEAGERTMKTTIMAILLDASRRQDEDE
jgi:hypothetical protein